MTDTNATVTAATTVATAVATPAVKAPSKKSQAVAIFQAKLAERAQGVFASNKAFRASVLVAIEAALGVSRASASTMFNSAKKEAEVINAELGLGRDPKKEKAPSTGQRGRPLGSKNKPKADAPAAVETAPVADTTVVVAATTEAVAEAAPAADAAAEAVA